jgi:hypothetical protein
MPQANGQPRGVGACVDLVVQIDGKSRVDYIHLEGFSLEETLRRVGSPGDADVTR